MAIGKPAISIRSARLRSNKGLKEFFFGRLQVCEYERNVKLSVRVRKALVDGLNLDFTVS